MVVLDHLWQGAALQPYHLAPHLLQSLWVQDTQCNHGDGSWNFDMKKDGWLLNTDFSLESPHTSRMIWNTQIREMIRKYMSCQSPFSSLVLELLWTSYSFSKWNFPDLLKWSYRFPNKICWVLRLEWLIDFEHVVQHMSFWVRSYIHN